MFKLFVKHWLDQFLGVTSYLNRVKKKYNCIKTMYVSAVLRLRTIFHFLLFDILYKKNIYYTISMYFIILFLH